MVSVEEVLRGSMEIDRMKAEIKQVTQALFGLAGSPRDCIGSRDPHELDCTFGSFPTNPAVWDICFTNTWHTRCRYYTLKGWMVAYGPDIPTVWKGKLKRLDFVGVKLAHTGLQVFVDGMIANFPGLQDRLDPILDLLEPPDAA